MANADAIKWKEMMMSMFQWLMVEEARWNVGRRVPFIFMSRGNKH
jgi:hypothetical protein